MYRAEIDGLRALAVVPVVLFHAGVGGFEGGFLGVDVFFVISGFLITSIILREFESSSFSLALFYERRVRRIGPPLVCVLVLSSLAAYFFLLPDELENYGQSVVATLVFCNNLLLYLTSGYWDLESEFKPLLHTWSLGVEEQFYIVLPLLFWFFYRFAKSYLAASLLVCVCLSFWYAFVVFESNRSLAFYSLFARAWELGVGCLAGTYVVKFGTVATADRGCFRSLLPFFGICLIFCGFWLGGLRGAQSSPLVLIFPVVGTFVVLVCAGSGLTHRLLCSAPFRWVGLASFSIYLWHQPLFAFLRAYNKDHPSSLEFSLAVMASFLLGYVTYRFVEQPFRRGKLQARSYLFGFCGLGSFTLVCVGLLFHFSNGLPSRLYDANEFSRSAHSIEFNESVRRMVAFNQTDGATSRVLVVGNSFGRDFVNILVSHYGNDRVSVGYHPAWKGDCLSAAPASAVDLIRSANVIVFASGRPDILCVDANISFARGFGKSFFVAGTKGFGVNLNWVMQLSREERALLLNPVQAHILADELILKSKVPHNFFVDLLGPMTVGDQIYITSARGVLLTTDRLHLTREGAVFLGSKVLPGSDLDRVISGRF